MKIKVNKEQLSLINEQQFNYDKNDVRRTIPKNHGMQPDDSTLLASKKHLDTDKVWEPSSEEQDKINKVRSKLLFYFDKTLDKITQLEKDIMKEKYSTNLNPRYVPDKSTDRVSFSEKKLEDLRGSIENVKEILNDETRLLELYDEGVFSVKQHRPKNPQEKSGDPGTEPSRNVIRKHMLLLRKEIENLDGIENKTPEQMELLQKYKTEYEKEFDSSILY